MRKLFLFAASLAVACSDPVSPADFQISVAPAPVAIKAGAAIQLAFEITNGSDEAHDLSVNACFPPFEILSAAGAVVGPGPRVCTLALTAPIRVDAKSTFETTFTWAGDALGTASDGSPIYLAPGSYFVRPRVNVVGVGDIYGTSVLVTIVP